MRTLILIYAIIFVPIRSPFAQNLKERAILYNDGIVLKQVEAGRLMQLFGESLQKKDIRLAEKVLAELQNTLQKHITSLKTMPAFEGNSTLRNAAYDLFQLYASVASNEYPAIMAEYRAAELSGKLNEERVIKLLEDVRQREATADKTFLESQKNFAHHFGFSLKENDRLQYPVREDLPSTPRPQHRTK